LSPRRGRHAVQLFTHWLISVAVGTTLHFVSQAVGPTQRIHIGNRRANDSPSPRGRGQGEGERFSYFLFCFLPALSRIPTGQLHFRKVNSARLRISRTLPPAP